MQNGNTIGWLALVIILLAVGYAALQEEHTQRPAPPVDVTDVKAPPAVSPRAERAQMKETGMNESPPRDVKSKKDKIVKPLLSEEEILGESNLPTEPSPEDRVLDPDFEAALISNSSVEEEIQNIGEYIDPDADTSLTSGTETAAQHVGEYIDPDADTSLTAEPESAPQHVGKFIDVDNEGVTQGASGKVVNMGEYIPVPD